MIRFFTAGVQENLKKIMRTELKCGWRSLQNTSLESIESKSIKLNPETIKLSI